MVHPTAGHHHKLVQRANINMHVVPLSQHVFTSWGSQSVVTANKLTQLTAKCLVPPRDDMTATLIPPPTQVRPGSVETKGQIKVTVITLSPSGKSYPPSSCIGGGEGVVDNAFKAVASPSLALTECQHPSSEVSHASLNAIIIVTGILI